MIQPIQSLEAALAQVDRSSFEAQLERAEAERRELLRRFPSSRWPEMTLEEFALGHDRSEDSFCSWLEFKALTIGSIRGGTARKLIIYKPRHEPGWYFPRGFDDEQAAWSRLRQDFVQAFELAEAGKWDEIDALELLSYGPALKLKTLHVYFPAEILPVYSSAHLRRYLRLVKGPEVVPPSSPVGLNRALLAALRERTELADWPTQTLMEFLYSWADPREAKRVYKIAPGEEARYWRDCLDNGYICVGWDDVGDLREFPSQEEFKAAFRECFADTYRDRQSKITEKANEVWKLMELEPGDLVVANKGISQVLAVGEVVEPGYVYRNDRTEYKHTVAVRWDPSFAKAIPAQKRWQFVTVAKVPDALVETILGPDGRVVPVDLLYLRIANALERKGQVILYGPPGTGKTYTARRFAVWWLLRQSRDPEADLVLADTERFRAAEARLSEAAVGSVSQLTRVTFHPSYTYEDFVEGFRPVETGGGGLSLRLQDGVFKRVCREAKSRPDLPFLILVDEINRGYVAKILGELLTFLERDKRGLTVLLPQSKETFSIPQNVYVLGTMNTADRSIKLLDAALRRRFAFLELMPDVDLLRGASVGELALDGFLEELNRRIARNEGREKQIGHAYLLDDRGQPVSDTEEFASRFREEILPLLQEYCYEDYATLRRYLGTELVDTDSGVLHHPCLEDPERLVAALAKELATEPSGKE